jgi:hypothetical protein
LLTADFAAASTAQSAERKGFELATDSHVCVQFAPSADTGQTITVNGKAIERDLRKPEGGRYTVRLKAGQHKLAIHDSASEVRGVQVKATEILPGQDIAYGDSGILELTKVMVDHPMFSPNGDHYHDTALFNADNFSTSLPGKKSGQYDFFLDWQWEIVEADSCASLGTVLTGRTQYNSPTNVQALWDGGDDRAAAGAVVPDGKYLYRYQASLTRSDGLVIDSVTSRAHGMLVDSTSSRWPNSLGGVSGASVGNLSNANFISSCNPSSDPDQCQCPSSSSLPTGTRCTYASVSSLEGFDDPSSVNTSSFITTTFDSGTDRWTVKVDLRNFNGGGLVPQSDGTWGDVTELQDFIEDLTGVPADSAQERLFNFDYVQLGYSTPVTSSQGAATGFNHFLLDLISDAQGDIIVDSTTYSLPQIFAAGGNSIPSKFSIANDRDGDECYHNGNTNGSTAVEARSCTEIRMANLDPGGTDIGIYRIKTRIFEYLIDGEGTTRENDCSSSGCSVRTFQRDAALIGAQRSHYLEDQSGVAFVKDVPNREMDTPALIMETDRTFFDGSQPKVYDGVCSEGGLSTYNNVQIPLDSADGALPGTCVINGIW